MSETDTFDSPDPAMVRLNLYLLPPTFLDVLGLGVYHSGVEVYGREYAFGKSTTPEAGIMVLRPGTAFPTLKYTIMLGPTALCASDVSRLVADLRHTWSGVTYHTTARNCNHFSAELASALGSYILPAFVNRPASLACCIPPMVISAAERLLPMQEIGNNEIGSGAHTQSHTHTHTEKEPIVRRNCHSRICS
eukprot:NODE_4229_length_821_cov_23.488473_g4071_i0.p1 GENE.NODE_4229_length_821_cov_23.488473_g4071_i0~~NODE_4229_length_821_cov_23.488473_g4071_i0.p1  ORF type:complete len:206 (-),score=50.29 NODE_4229_length_821_cov_23.488473_g4071_i0:204-779(-)